MTLPEKKPVPLGGAEQGQIPIQNMQEYVTPFTDEAQVKGLLEDANYGAAIGLAINGLAIFPVNALGSPKVVKTPYVEWTERSTWDLMEVCEHWAKHPGAAPALDCGKSDLVILDADRKHGIDGVAEWKALVAFHGDDGPPVAATPNAGLHTIYRQRKGVERVRNAGSLAKLGIDVRGDGGYVLAPGAVVERNNYTRQGDKSYLLTPGKSRQLGKYELIRGDLANIPELPLWLHEMLTTRRKSAQTPAAHDPIDERELEKVRHALSFIPVFERDKREVWLAFGMALKSEFGEEARAVWDEWSAASGKYDEAGQGKWDSFAGRGEERKDNPVTVASIIRMARKYGWVPPYDPNMFGDVILPPPQIAKDGSTAALEFAGASTPSNVIPYPGTHAGEHGVKDEGWPELKPLETPVLPVPVFDCGRLLPAGPLRDYVASSATANSCPPDFVAVPLLCSLGSLIGYRLTIRPYQKDDSWVEAPNLWGVVISPPASRKTAGIGAGEAPLRHLIAREAKRTQTAKALLESAEDETGVKSKAIKAAEKGLTDAINLKTKEFTTSRKKSPGTLAEGRDPSELLTLDAFLERDEDVRRAQEVFDSLKPPKIPEPRRYLVSDATPEFVANLAAKGPVYVTRDELMGLLASFTRQGHESSRALYLEGWNGLNSFQQDRIGRGETYIESLCLSVCGGTQPDKLIRYIDEAERGFENDGFVNRFQLMVYPETVGAKYRDEATDHRPGRALREIFEEVDQLTDPQVAQLKFGARIDAKNPYVRFAPDAQEIFKAFFGANEGQVKAEKSTLLQQHYGKYKGLMVSLALIFHVVDLASGKGSTGGVSREAARRAVDWCEYLGEHAKRVYGMLTTPQWRAAHAIEDLIKDGKLTEGFTKRDAIKTERGHLKNEKAVEAALEILEENGYLRSAKSQGPGRSTVRYSINPAMNAGSVEAA